MSQSSKYYLDLRTVNTLMTKEAKNSLLNINVQPNEKPLVGPEQMNNYIDEIFNDIREDRNTIDEVLANFMDSVGNGQDATTSSKEALVNLLNLKAQCADRKIKTIDVLAKIYIRDNTTPRITANQKNEFNISDRREFLKTVQAELTNAK